MSHISYTTIHRYLPPTVKRIIARGGDCWIGEIDETTVLKYPQVQGKPYPELQIEAKMLSVLGRHPRIVQSKGLTKDGLLLEFAPNGNLHDYLTANPDTSLEQRVTWCMQATEAVRFIHSKRILHCDLRHDNFLLDAKLDLKLADFQGQHFSADGEILLDGLSLESTKAYLPRTPADHARIKTDLFALGGVIYFIMMGHEVFPDLDSSNDEQEIERRFRAGDFPADQHAFSKITGNCWKLCYSSAQQVLADLQDACGASARSETLDRLAEHISSVSDEETSLLATSWLSGLCEEPKAPKVPPRIRQLVGFD
ncbi:kinase-like protein [Cucurbitaria berberidis CBS 394.84]|uniref:EKC/KEOPS complex subunit BUD32 n=1 Tax=Cucurbitaria berberidis CBS 394.84 TaxID=1168544 RepID=A0A9P4L4K2_9PLEO|nr:kinase-like protein [Cucurbitaria berberidis CBS 394.84]KAF1842061.1 kinase-like protein [Cucurbitaria berberidis CBS 394.84]